MADLVVVRSKIKEHAEGCNVSGDFANALNEEVGNLIKRAASRAKANGRKTVSSKDL
jgi:histone H3/H4